MTTLGEHSYPETAGAPSEDPYFAGMIGIYQASTTYGKQLFSGVEDPYMTALGQDLQERPVPAGMFILSERGTPIGYVNQEGHARELEYEEDGKTPRVIPPEVEARLRVLTGDQEGSGDAHHASHIHHPAGEESADTEDHHTTPDGRPRVVLTPYAMGVIGVNQASGRRAMYEAMSALGRAGSHAAAEWLLAQAQQTGQRREVLENAQPRGRHHSGGQQRPGEQHRRRTVPSDVA